MNEIQKTSLTLLILFPNDKLKEIIVDFLQLQFNPYKNIVHIFRTKLYLQLYRREEK